MSLARSTYYRHPDPGRHSARQAEEAALRATIEDVVAEWPAYGYRRVTHELKRRGMRVNHKRVARVMREEALTPQRVRRFLTTTDSKHAEPVFPNLLPEVRHVFASACTAMSDRGRASIRNDPHQSHGRMPPETTRSFHP